MDQIKIIIGKINMNFVSSLVHARFFFFLSTAISLNIKISINRAQTALNHTEIVQLIPNKGTVQFITRLISLHLTD